MNKRSLLFVSLVGMAFVGCQIFFGYNDFRSCKALTEKQKTISEQVLAATKSMGLGVSPWTTHPDEEVNKNHYAVCIGDRLLLLNQGNSASSVYSSGSRWDFIEETTACDNIHVALYGETGKSTVPSHTGKVFLPVTSEALPVLVVEFRNNQEPIVFLGQYKQDEGKVYNKDSQVYGTSLVFWRSGNEYLPLGIYNSKEERLESLDLPMTKAAIFSNSRETNTDTHSGQYFVLSNEYMQLVISQESGAIEGINLPFSSEDSKSIVNEIGFDRDLKSQVPSEASFPGLPSVGPNNQIVSDTIGGYYPLLRRGILSDSKKRTPASYHALNIVSGRDLVNPVTSGYRVSVFNSNVLELESYDGSIKKTYTFPEQQPYAFEVAVGLNRSSDDMWITSGVPEVEIMSNTFSPAIKYRVIKKNKGQLDKVKLPQSKDPLSLRSGVYPQWILNSNGYFGIILSPLTDIPAGYAAAYVSGNSVPTRLSLLYPKNQAYPASKYPGYETLLPLPKEEGTYRFLVYAGPLAEPTLKALDRAYTNPKGENSQYLDCITFRGLFAFITEPFAALLFIIMKFFKMITGSWGISIILLTVFLKLLLYPLNAWSIRSMRRMQKLSPYIQEIQQKYKKEPKRAQMEVMALYKTNKVNPITGCLPLLIQLPFLIAMFDLLKSSFLLRGASFIPGWIDNLTAPDVLFSWTTPVWFIGNEFHLLPILLGVVMFIQQKLSALQKKGPVTDQQRQQEAMGTMMALLFTFMFYNFPSGLNIYWFSSMLLGLIQQWVTNKILDRQHLKNEITVNKKKQR
ncbi:putative inner membrane protein translocase component YidC [Chlamydia abortus]|uniref:membrane protein insertase YidC n=1 Tax=Chlamydia abortus TaxID=83555 RepID=UPI000A27AA28|nr:membrane protein insertase YidC [Chlamydia abortus]ASD30623.1 membrane protein insertase YidC [Chlamydia abortus]SGA15551.1 putative inner membrane protein translocase component YidC [Chlamydia abortus]SGA22799.1 putative inner membrane protein translocase component YidC [Chlamydia abortus]SGA26935.1 putative inner membrane protein translocase component YidC [Chlamydia abortus]SHD82217.1 putative inner membrane protein translocase component YidC [Chlamydia abortus]